MYRTYILKGIQIYINSNLLFIFQYFLLIVFETTVKHTALYETYSCKIYMKIVAYIVPIICCRILILKIYLVYCIE